MNESIKRLLFTGEPYSDEGFIGYVLRLASLNEIPDLRWILKMAGLNKLYDYRYKFNSDFRVAPEPLAKLAGTTSDKISRMLYLHEQGRKNHIIGNMIVFDVPIPNYLVRRERPKICPACLQESNYCRKVWELAPVTVCPIHHLMLIEHCPNCRGRIKWQRPAVNICQCDFDYRDSELSEIDSDQVRLAAHIYRAFSLSCSAANEQITPASEHISGSEKNAINESVFKYPLDTLALGDLLKLLFFVGAHYARVPDYIGTNISQYLTNAEIHEILIKAVEVFDDWAGNYHRYIAEWIEKDKKYFINCKQVYLSRRQLPNKYSKFELYNQFLHYGLDEERFGFMHDEFKSFLKRSLIEEPWQPTSFEDFIKD